MLYLDSAIFIYAAISRETIGERARALLLRVRDTKEEAVSCALTFDELVWVVRKHRSREDALSAGESFLAFPNLTILDVDEGILRLAASTMRRYPLGPRDSIHVAAALVGRCSAIVSSDKHFDQVDEIKRQPI